MTRVYKMLRSDAMRLDEDVAHEIFERGWRCDWILMAASMKVLRSMHSPVSHRTLALGWKPEIINSDRFDPSLAVLPPRLG